MRDFLIGGGWTAFSVMVGWAMGQTQRKDS